MLSRVSFGAFGWPAAMIVWGPGFTSATHRHHSVQLIMTMHAELRVRGGPAEEWRKCGAVLVRPDAAHEVDAQDGLVVIGFFACESELGLALCERIHGDFLCVGASQVARWRAALGPEPGETQVERWVREHLLRRRRAVSIHPGVARVLEHLPERLANSAGSSLDSLAALSGLSRSRFMHAFTESVGVPLRPYVLWLRLQQAMCELTGGANVTTAAQNAGFSDAAHLTRTFRRMLGLTPTELQLHRRASRGIAAHVRVRLVPLFEAEPYRRAAKAS